MPVAAAAQHVQRRNDPVTEQKPLHAPQDPRTRRAFDPGAASERRTPVEVRTLEAGRPAQVYATPSQRAQSTAEPFAHHCNPDLTRPRSRTAWLRRDGVRQDLGRTRWQGLKVAFNNHLTSGMLGRENVTLR
jgi:hypothetical protein